MKIRYSLAACIGLLVCACGSGDDNGLLGSGAQPVIDNYAVIVQASYDDTVTAAGALKQAVDDFVADPSDAGFQAAKEAWLASREPYELTEAYRFYDGPIDDPDTGPEGQLNSWPLDEAYIDYVQDDAASGIINNTTDFPTLSSELIAAQNTAQGEKSISTGYHAIEFLLWGQDFNVDGPGDRPYTDYVVGSGGTADNQERRGQYLQLVTDLLLSDVQFVAKQWAANKNNYRREFVDYTTEQAIGNMLTGMGSLSGAELSGERMSTAYDNRDQEDEHSCFSDNTHRDLYLDAVSIQNVYLGRYGDHDGPGIDELVEQLNFELNTKLKKQLQASVTAIQAIPIPFDQALLDDVSRVKIDVAIRALQKETDTIAEVASELGITLNLQ